jgi:ribose 5-phosphate isomerase A
MSDAEKEDAARKAAAYVEKGMVLGLGTGSTAAHFIRIVGELEAERKLGLRCIATSVKSEKMALECGLSLVNFGEFDAIDLAVDGADVIVGKNLIKGLGGGAIAREKAVDYRAGRFVVIADCSKVKKVFGGVVPVEVLGFSSEAVKRELLGMGAEKVEYRGGSGRFVTDNGNFILDAFFGEIREPRRMERELNCIPGVVENGLFTRDCEVLVGGV